MRRQQRTSASSFSAKAENPVRASALHGHSRATGSPACAGDDDGGSADIFTNNAPQCRQQSPSMSSTTNLYVVNNEPLRR
ncbi:hypothetical protein [Undibacterium sp. MH2W]|uniref:hypothetical protein n=1 Tax=Undibacterium sp. MH2W TaxID=3413044 RepID=UPI003BF57B32